jgi:hypothetical protein
MVRRPKGKALLFRGGTARLLGMGTGKLLADFHLELFNPDVLLSQSFSEHRQMFQEGGSGCLVFHFHPGPEGAIPDQKFHPEGTELWRMQPKPDAPPAIPQRLKGPGDALDKPDPLYICLLRGAFRPSAP